MKETVLLFGFTDRDRCSRLKRGLLPLKIRIKEIEKKEYQNPLGYLAGNRDIPPAEEEYQGRELEGEMLVMAGISSSGVDAVLAAVKRSGVGSIPYKAVLTAANQHWNVPELFEEIKEEHRQMSGKGE